MSNKQPILFMFLGGLPPLDDKHWEKFLNGIDDNLYIIVHPQHLTPDTLNDNILSKPLYKKLYDKKQLHIILLEEYHVKTAWATFSLVAAVLLMMEYMLMNFGDIFHKYVLLSSADYPLYNYNVLYNELISDNKSWIYYDGKNEHGGYARKHYKKMYDYEGGVFTIDDVTHMSQWCTLYKKHVKFFFHDDTINQKERTYYIIQDKYCKNNKIDIVASKYQKYQEYINSHMGTYSKYIKQEKLENILTDGYCIASDECFFGAVIKKNIGKSIDNLLKNIRYYNISKLKKYNKHKFIESLPIESLYDQHKSVYSNYYISEGHITKLSHTYTTDDLRTWYGSRVAFNLENKEKRINYVKEEDELVEDITDPTNPISKRKYIPNPAHFYVEDNKIRTTTLKDIYNHIDISNNPIMKGKSIVKERYEDIYTISSTYTDWSLINTSPSNIFRGMDDGSMFSTTDKAYFKDDPNFIGIINHDTKITDIFINIINNGDILDVILAMLLNPCKSTNGNSPSITAPSSHPVEYDLFTIKAMVNAYNIIEFFGFDKKYVNGGPMLYNHFRQVKHIYENIIKSIMNNNANLIDNFGNPIDTTNMIYFINVDKNDPDYGSSILYDHTFYCFNYAIDTSIIQNYLLGYPITSRILNNALNYGGLFIRKVMKKNSNIELYTDELFKLTSYAHKNHNDFYNKLSPSVSSNNYPLDLKSYNPICRNTPFFEIKCDISGTGIETIKNIQTIKDINLKGLPDINNKDPDKKAITYKELLGDLNPFDIRKELDDNEITCVFRRVQKKIIDPLAKDYDKNKHKANILLIYFSDINENFKYIEKYYNFEGNILLFCDRKNNFYDNMNDIVEYTKNFIKDINANKVIVIGQYMGGYAALYLSTQIDALCLAFRPITYYSNIMVNNITKKNIVTHNNLVPTISNIKNLINISTTESLRYVYYGNISIDYHFANRIVNTSNTYIHKLDLKNNIASATKINKEVNLYNLIDRTKLFEKIYNYNSSSIPSIDMFINNILNMSNKYNNKYLKYKQKYIELKKLYNSI